MSIILCTSKTCEFGFSTEEAFMEHLKKHHYEDSNYKCYKCLVSFCYVYRLNRHLTTCNRNLEERSNPNVLLNDGDSSKESEDLTQSRDSYEDSNHEFNTGNDNSSDVGCFNESEELTEFRDSDEHSNVEFTTVNENSSDVGVSMYSDLQYDSSIPVCRGHHFLENKLDDLFINPTDGLYAITLKLLGKMTITKNLAFEIFSDVYFQIVIPILKTLKLNDKKISENLEMQIQKFLDTHGTEYKFRNNLRHKSMYFPATKFEILLRHTVLGRSKKSYGYIFPMQENIKTFFEIHDYCLKEMIDFSELEHNGNITKSVINGAIWNDKIDSYENSYVLPICVYQDDVEINNPLESKSGVEKISAVYISFPLLGKYI